MERSAGLFRMGAGFDPQGLATYLRQAHPVKTAAAVEAATRLPARTVERWLAMTATPSVVAFGRLVAVYGPALLSAAVPGLAWVERAALLAEREGMAREIAALETRLAETATKLGIGP